MLHISVFMYARVYIFTALNLVREGNVLSRVCSYRGKPQTPPPRHWSPRKPVKLVHLRNHPQHLFPLHRSRHMVAIEALWSAQVTVRILLQCLLV